MARRTSLLLSLLIVAAGLAAAVAYARMDKFRDDAERARANLAGARASMAQIRAWRSSPGRATAATMDASQLSARLREAATAAGLADAPGSEPDKPRRLGDSDYEEMPVYLRFEPLTLKQLTTFLVTLARIDPSSRAKSIELSPPTQGGAGGDLWIADVTVGYLTYAPRK
jgi:hypothetical protein